MVGINITVVVAQYKSIIMRDSRQSCMILISGNNCVIFLVLSLSSRRIKIIADNTQTSPGVLIA